jgi:hypothetical protein
MKFFFLKRTYPISQFDRECDGYRYIIENTTEKEREELNINLDNLKTTIKKGEKYMYEVGKFGLKKNKGFEVKYISLENFEIIRKKIFGTKDD